jgi:hypothetical protein
VRNRILPNYEHAFHTLVMTEWIEKQFPAFNSDLSIKRNVGLALARMLTWRRMFFLDDDTI